MRITFFFTNRFLGDFTFDIILQTNKKNSTNATVLASARLYLGVVLRSLLHQLLRHTGALQRRVVVVLHRLVVRFLRINLIGVLFV